MASATVSTASQYDQFMARFKNKLAETADFDTGDMATTMDVIESSLADSGLRELLNQLDRASASNVAQGAAPADNEPARKRVVRKRKTDAAPAATGSGSKVAASKADNATVDTTRTRRVTAYNLFIAQKVRDDKVPMKVAAGEWKELSDEQRKSYTKKAEEMNSAAPAQ